MTVYDEELNALLHEFPKFQIIRKSDSSFMKFLSFLLFFNRDFMTRFTTTIGNRMWVTDSWEDRSPESRAITIRHERIHLRQQKRYGMLVYALMYLLFPVPMLFAWGRALLEKEAYAESIWASVEYYGSGSIRIDDNYWDRLRESTIRHFTTGEYGWMWVRRKDIETWYDGVMRNCVASLREA